ncbi:hypothetical protein [Actinomadura geliboluensis]|uniref:hypothetical protein n=1 Tax=Actinomadura geliboluensis TaxID=882440 RepID=UPI00369B1B4D
MDKLLESLAGPWTKRWTGHVAAAALTFWAIGLSARLVSGGGSATACRAGGPADPLGQAWCRLDGAGAVGYAALVVLAGSLVIGSALLVAAATPRIVHVIAGDVPRPGGLTAWSLWEWLLRRQIARRRRAAQAPGPPEQAALPDALDAAEREMARVALLGRIERDAIGELYRYPAADALMAPTRIGCALAAMVERVERRHGLNLAACWEHLLMVLPPDARARLAQESRRVTLRGQNLVWTLAAVLWTPTFGPSRYAVGWVLGIALVTALLMRGVREAVENYCDLIEALMTCYRDRIYTAVGFAQPTSTTGDVAAGRVLSEYLGGWADDPAVPLSWPAPEAAPCQGNAPPQGDGDSEATP